MHVYCTKRKSINLTWWVSFNCMKKHSTRDYWMKIYWNPLCRKKIHICKSVNSELESMIESKLVSRWTPVFLIFFVIFLSIMDLCEALSSREGWWASGQCISKLRGGWVVRRVWVVGSQGPPPSFNQDLIIDIITAYFYLLDFHTINF